MNKEAHDNSKGSVIQFIKTVEPHKLAESVKTLGNYFALARK